MRDCSQCSKKVYNLSTMTESEAERFLQTNRTSKCIQFYRRSDGKIMTEKCPAIVRKIRNKMRSVASLIAGLIASMFAIDEALAAETASAKSNAQVYSIRNQVLTSDSFQQHTSYIVGMGVMKGGFSKPKSDGQKEVSRNGKEWHNPGYKSQLGREAYKEYKKAGELKSKNKLDSALRHYQRSLNLCLRMDDYAITLHTAGKIHNEIIELKEQLKKVEETK